MVYLILLSINDYLSRILVIIKEKPVEARIEVGLEDRRWHTRRRQIFMFLRWKKPVEARTEAGLDEPRWHIICCRKPLFLKWKTCRGPNQWRPRRASMEPRWLLSKPCVCVVIVICSPHAQRMHTTCITLQAELWFSHCLESHCVVPCCAVVIVPEP